MFSAHVLNIGIAVALPTVLLLALDQNFATDSFLELTWRCCKGFVALSWSVGLLLSLVLVHISGAYWYSFSKLPLSVTPHRAGLVLIVAAVLFGAVVGMIIVLSFVTFWRTLKGGAVRCHLTLVLLTAIFHTATAVAGGAALLLPLAGHSTPGLELSCFLCWWSFLSFICWHPWLICLPRRIIRESAMTLLRGHPWLERILAHISWLGNARTLSPSPSPRPEPAVRLELAPGRRHRLKYQK